ncbi:Fic family protein [Salibacterium qingdaonense]|uniref:Fic family protein n=1 Tax=Salibacterium qingdaonense TaxID=266892 RepID=UPI000B86357A|nr:Fic family protein [Salibacterium qingdaonense]
MIRTTPPFHVPEAIQALVDWYEKEIGAMHPEEAASRLHSRFVNIHPFLGLFI